MNNGRNLKRVSGLLLVATVIALVVHFVGLDMFNKRVLEVHGNDSNNATYMAIDARQDSTSTWIKRDYDMYGKTVDITGATIDGELHNMSHDTVGNWTLTINIAGDCFINQAWNGEVEIHQFAGSADETVQRLNLQNYNLDDVMLEYLYDGDLLIPLQAGDYIVYYPNEKFKEVPLAGNDSTKIGVIFYYLDTIDLTNYDLVFQYHRTFTQGPTFLIFVLFSALFFIFVLMYVVSDVTYKQAQNEMELRKSGLSSLSGMYAAIYLIDLTTSVMTPVSVDEKAEHLRLWSNGTEAFFKMIIVDAEEAYKDIVSEFLDIDTLPERLKGRDSVVCEYISKKFGWSSMRFFTMDRAEGQLAEKVVFTAQDVNEEKSELNRIEERVTKAESETEAKNAFLANVSQEIQEPIRGMIDLGKRIASESGEAQTRVYANELCGLGGDLLLFVDDVLDYSELEAGRIQLESTNYSLRNLVRDNAKLARLLLGRQRLSFDLDASETLPDGLRGDAARLKQVIGIIIANAAETIDANGVKLSVFGKAENGNAHILISVRATELNTDTDTTAKLDSSQARRAPHTGVGIDLVKGLLSLMDSELKVVQSDDAWYECYFEVVQEIVDPTPIGKITLEDVDAANQENGR